MIALDFPFLAAVPQYSASWIPRRRDIFVGARSHCTRDQAGPGILSREEGWHPSFAGGSYGAVDLRLHSDGFGAALG